MGARAGKCRKINRTGDVVGPYVVVGPVGEEWRTSIYWRVQCPDCGHELSVQVKGLYLIARRKSCGKCGRKVAA